jgi:hypothetical protein
MPIDIKLSVQSGEPWPALRRCPSIERAREKDEQRHFVDVTALALEEDIYGQRYLLDPDDASFLAREGNDDVLVPGDIADESGAPVVLFAGVLRVRFLGWVAKTARATSSSITIVYSHERGDWLYELARWTFVAKEEELFLASFDGTDTPRWQGRRERSSTR